MRTFYFIDVYKRQVSGALSLWKERLNDIRRKPGNYTLNGVHDWANRRTADLNDKMCIRDRQRGV